jgi:hypothetical protein
MVVAAAVAVAPPTPLLPRVYGPPTSTPRSTLFKCGRILRGGRRPETSLMSRLLNVHLGPRVDFEGLITNN